MINLQGFNFAQGVQINTRCTLLLYKTSTKEQCKYITTSALQTNNYSLRAVRRLFGLRVQTIRTASQSYSDYASGLFGRWTCSTFNPQDKLCSRAVALRVTLSAEANFSFFTFPFSLKNTSSPPVTPCNPRCTGHLTYRRCFSNTSYRPHTDSTTGKPYSLQGIRADTLTIRLQRTGGV